MMHSTSPTEKHKPQPPSLPPHGPSKTAIILSISALLFWVVATLGAPLAEPWVALIADTCWDGMGWYSVPNGG